MKTILLLLVSLSCIGQSRINLSDSSSISVITCGPWQGELYTAFGHSAFRVKDEVNGIDLAFNYGVFDFDQPNFYLNFARGYLYYKLGVSDFDRFQYPYIYYNRYIHEQELNLTQDQKQKLFDFLQWNALPENADYRYDYFYDNCATKIPDVVIKVLGDTVKFDGSYIKTDYTIRELTDLYLDRQPWGDLGIDIGLGLPIDKKATPYQYMFLPEYVESGFDHATISHDGHVVPIVKKKNIIYASRDEDSPKGLPNPFYVFSVLTLLAAWTSFRDFKNKKLSVWLDVLLFGAVGLVGLLLCFLWFFTDHQASRNNLNILWALPSHLIIVIALTKQQKWLSYYFLTTACISVLLLVLWPVLPQKLHYGLIPIILAIAIRSFTHYRIRKAKQSNYTT